MHAPLSTFSYNHLTVPGETIALDYEEPSALPILSNPELTPLARAAVVNTEPLVAVTNPRVLCLEAYRNAGWEQARPGTWLRKGVARRLYSVADTLPERFGLAVFDAWRPIELQREIYDAAYKDPDLPAGFVNVPSRDPGTPPPHFTGGTVDITLTFDGRALALGTDFDGYNVSAATCSFEDRPGNIRTLRRLLYWSMRSQGFVVIPNEWWHFEYGTRLWSALTGQNALYGAILPTDSEQD